MSQRNVFGWDLPPGCTQRDIERAMGADGPDCALCGAVTGGHNTHKCDCGDYVCNDCWHIKRKCCKECAKKSPCCGVTFDPDLGRCPKCGESV